MTPKEAIEWLKEQRNQYVSSDPYAISLDMAIESLEKQISESPLMNLTADDGTEVIGQFCPCCHAVLDRDELYIKRCRCGKALVR